MPDVFTTQGALMAVTIFVIVALVTVALGFFWEGIRRWLRARRASIALKAVAERSARDAGETGARPAGPSILRADGTHPGPPWLEAIVVRLPHREDLQRLLDQAGIRALSIQTLLLVSVGLGAGIGGIALGVVGNWFIAIAVASVASYLPLAYLKIKRTKRFAAFEEGFPDAIDLLARAARAGHSLASGLEVVADEGEEPVASEFRQVFEEQRFGLPIQDALLGLADRVDLVDVRILVTAVLIQRESGGNLAENLDGLSSVIRGRFRFKRDVKTKTAHGRITGLVVALAPVVAGVGMSMVNPEYMEPMFTEALGRMMLGVGGLMMLAGFFVIRRMVDIKF